MKLDLIYNTKAEVGGSLWFGYACNDRHFSA